MRLVSDRVRRALKWPAIVVGSMLAMGWAVGALYPNDWRPIEASVQSTRIESVRYGNLQWALMVEAAYEVSGQSYATRRDVFHDVDYDAVEAEGRNWPPGRSFRLYVDAKNPGSASLVPDGGREATVVTAVTATASVAPRGPKRSAAQISAGKTR